MGQNAVFIVRMIMFSSPKVEIPITKTILDHLCDATGIVFKYHLEKNLEF